MTTKSLQGHFRTKFGINFNYETTSKHFCLSLPEGRGVSIRGKCFSKIRVIVKPSDHGHWKVDPSFVDIRRKEPMHEPTKAQLDEIYSVLNQDFDKHFHEINPLLKLQYKKFVRNNDILHLQGEREKIIQQIKDLESKRDTLTQQLEKFL
jgi:hypothetical protein